MQPNSTPKKSFQYVKPSNEVVELMQTYRDLYQVLADKICELPNGRGVASALTKLEESAFWLNKGLTLND